MAFVQFTQPDHQPIVINTERIITAAPAPPDGQGTRITFTNGGHQDVKELIADVLRRLNIKQTKHRNYRSATGELPAKVGLLLPIASRLKVPESGEKKEE